MSGEAVLTHIGNCAAGFDDVDCTCGLKQRSALQTEQTMHAAWRKRAEEAETELAALRNQLATVTAERDKFQSAIENALRVASGDPEGVIDWAGDVSALLMSYVDGWQDTNDRTCEALSELQRRIDEAPVSYLIHAADGRLVEQWGKRELAQLEARATWPGSTVTRVRLLAEPEPAETSP